MRPGPFVIVLLVGACSFRGDEPFRHGGKTPPNFAGIFDAMPYSAYAVLVSWGPANDDTTEPNSIEYDVWKSDTAGGEDLAGTPTVTVVGARRALVGGLAPGQKYFFIVRAKDQDGNSDGNFVEFDATTLTPPPATRTMAVDVAPILFRSCADAGRCHGPPSMGMGMEQGMDFSTAASAATALIDVPAKTQMFLGRLRVKSGDSGHSFIMNKLLAILSPDDGSQMPYDNSLEPITDDQIRLIAEWIDQGAMR